jgi:hypothetical protein
MKRFVVFGVLLMLCGLGDEAAARRESLTPQQKDQLQKVQRIYVEALALTDKGQVDAGWIQDMATRRLQALGYTVTADAAQPHDVHVKIKCEQRKVWEGTTSSGGDADLPDSPLRAWKGPACQLTYFLNGKSTQWKKEVRTEFVDAIQAAAQAKAEDPGAYALDQLQLRLEEYDFPVRLTADWNQDDRLLTVLADPKAPPIRKARVISLLGEMFSEKAVPQLVSSLKDPESSVAAAAALALGNIGHQQSVSALVEMLKTGSSEMRIAAAKALGKLGALHGDASVIPPLLDALNTDDLAFKTEVVWALGQLPDRRAYEPLLALQRSLRNVRTSDRSSQEGKLWDAVSYGLKQLDGFDQIN